MSIENSISLPDNSLVDACKKAESVMKQIILARGVRDTDPLMETLCEVRNELEEQLAQCYKIDRGLVELASVSRETAESSTKLRKSTGNLLNKIESMTDQSE